MLSERPGNVMGGRQHTDQCVRTNSISAELNSVPPSLLHLKDSVSAHSDKQ
jgi:hypothetical protein